MAELHNTRNYDVCFVVDSTGSMRNYFSALEKALPELLGIFRIVGNIDRVAVLAYGDYPDMHDLIRWSGWHKEKMSKLAEFVVGVSRNMSNGHDSPEAVRTAAFNLLGKLQERDRESQGPKQTIVVWYADFPPHSHLTRSNAESLQTEKNILGVNFDWLVLCRKLKAAGAIVFPVIYSTDRLCIAYYALLAAFTGGSTLVLNSLDARMITLNSISLFLNLANQGPCDFAQCSRVTVNPSVLQVTAEDTAVQQTQSTATFHSDPNSTAAQIPALAGYSSTLSLVQRFEVDESYKALVFQVLEEVADSSAVLSLTYNPLFVSVWKALCKDRADPRRVSLLERMSRRVSTMDKAEDKKTIKEYLNSNDFQFDVQEGLRRMNLHVHTR